MTGRTGRRGISGLLFVSESAEDRAERSVGRWVGEAEASSHAAPRRRARWQEAPASARQGRGRRRHLHGELGRDLPH